MFFTIDFAGKGKIIEPYLLKHNALKIVTTQRIHLLPHICVVFVLNRSHIFICSLSPCENALT